jgi:hypothetical protein
MTPFCRSLFRVLTASSLLTVALLVGVQEARAQQDCAAVRASSPGSPSGIYTVNLNGTPIPVYCDMTTAGGGWTLVAQELADQTGNLKLLDVDTNNPQSIANGTASGNIGPRFAGLYDEIWIQWGTDYAWMRIGWNIFGGMVNQAIPVTDFATSDAALADWVKTAGGAEFCVANALNSLTMYGDTSWAFKPSSDTNIDCGCNSGSWWGQGAYYGGWPEGQCNQCYCWDGGFAGVRDNGVQKGGITPTYPTQIFVRRSIPSVPALGPVGLATMVLGLILSWLYAVHGRPFRRRPEA